MSDNRGLLGKLKSAGVALVGRDRANRITAPFYDRSAQQRTVKLLAKLPAHDLCVNIGCGPKALDGWINLDAARAPHIDVVWDLRHGLPFPDESCSAIFGEHVIEHIPRTDAGKLIAECRRALQPGGVLRLSTPDAGRFLRSYCGDQKFLDDPRFPDPAETAMDRVNMMMREHGTHLWVYDAESLKALLLKAGFVSVAEQEFHRSLHPRMQAIDSPEREFESLYMEATK
jgi:predicted SAM-dependent methyltransferase